MKLVFATNNPNKLKEVQSLVPNNITLLSLKDIGCLEDIPETGNTLEENAQLKANYVTNNYGYDCFADDTGLLANALNGVPGVYSARYAGEQKSSEDNMNKLLKALENKVDRTAYFKTAIALNIQSNKIMFSGRVDGVITHQKTGKGGFGYDPIFQPNEYNVTFAEISLEEKNKISHRGRAMQKLIIYLNEYFYS